MTRGTGWRAPGWASGLDAEIVVSSPSCGAVFPLVPSASKLARWGDALNRLEAGEDISWMELDRGPLI
jgi:hypothetical protein